MSAVATETDLLWRNVHHLDFCAGHVRDLGGSTEEDILFKLQRSPSRVAACGERRTEPCRWRRCHRGSVRRWPVQTNVFLFLVGGEVADDVVLHDLPS